MTLQSSARGYADESIAIAARRAVGHAAQLWPLIGCLLAQAFAIALAVFAFRNISDRTQTITVALLGLVYVSIRCSMLAHSAAMRRLTAAFECELLALKNAMAAGFESDPATEAERHRSVDAHNRRIRLEQTGLAIIALICLYHLGEAVFWGMAYAQVFELR
jgi:hypothetical protein